jgi:hypothetical protein
MMTGQQRLVDDGMAFKYQPSVVALSSPDGPK